MPKKKEQVNITTKLKVFINCGGKCGFPNCKTHLVDEDSIIGEIAHIKGQQPGGPRYDKEQPEEERNAPENLIALCQKHHKIIDDHPKKYSEQDILGWKSEIEEWAKKSPEKTELSKEFILIILLDLEKELDKGNGEFVLKTLKSISVISETFGDDNIKSELEILEARVMQSLEKIEEAKTIFERTSKIYPKNIKSALYLAEIYLNEGNYIKNDELLNKAREIDNSHWLFVIEQLIRNLRLNQDIDILTVDEKKFPKDRKQSAIYYRIYSYFYQKYKMYEKADEFIEKSIKLYPHSFSSFNTKLSFYFERLIEKGFPINHIEEADIVLKKIKEIEENINWDHLYFGSSVILEFRKFYIYIIQQNRLAIISTGKKLIDLILLCSFDLDIDNFLCFLLTNYRPEDEDFEKILRYLGDKQISSDLCKTLALQFCGKGKLLTYGKSFLLGKNEKIDNLILKIEEDNEIEVVGILRDDLQLMLSFANCLKDNPKLRKKIIDNIPEDENIQKDRIYLLYYCDTKKYDEAFDIIKNIDFEQSNYFECELSLKPVREKQAWEIEAKILERLFSLEADETKRLSFKLDQFTSYMKLADYLGVIGIGKFLLENAKTTALMDKKNQELLLGQTIAAYLQRGDEKEALNLLLTHPNIIYSFEFIVSVEAEVYLKNKDYEKAVSALCRAVKKVKKPTKEQYGYLFFPFTQLNSYNLTKIKTLNKVANNSFVKLKNEEQWYFIGDGNELDATKISTTNDKYQLFINKKLNDNIIFPEDKYQTNKEKRVIENILNLEPYINWKAHDSFFSLSKQGRWDAGIAIEVPEKDGKVDIDNMVNFMKDQQEQGKGFFDDYCINNYPFAFLCVNEGGVTNAIGKIINENRGFIRFSDGSIQDIERQKKVAEKIINGAEAFLDGTTAIFLAETGLLKKILPFIPNLKTPQSVINLLFKVSEKFNITPGQAGYMRYAKDRLVFDKIDKKKNIKIRNNFKQSIEFLEKNKKNIISISKANKSTQFTESKMPNEVIDACILAQKSKGVILTEDFLYLQANNLQTKKGIPEYCSLFSLMKLLLEKDLIKFADYLNIYSYLSSYRCRFLDLNVDILIRAVFGDASHRIFTPKNIINFNFALTLSEEYGVKTETAIQILSDFFARIIVTNLVTPEQLKDVCKNALPSFLYNRDKKIIGKLLFEYCSKLVGEKLNNNGLLILPSLSKDKIAILKKQIEIASL